MPSEILVYEFRSDVRDAIKGIEGLTSSFKSLEKSSTSATKNNKKFTVSWGSIILTTRKLANALQDVSNQLKSVKTESGLASKALKALVGINLGKWLADGTKSAIDYTETMNLFSVAMKESINTGKEFVDTVAEMYGLDPKWLMDATGMFYEMAYAVGMPDKAARNLSTSLTALSVDLASLFNKDVETVSDNIISGLRGQSRAVVKYGMDLRATTIEQYALTLGITQNYETMNEASREILRYLVMINQARDATGDFAKTIESPANQLRVLKEQFIQLGRAIGNIFLKALAPVLPVINGIIMAIRTMIEAISALFGIKFEFPEFSTGSVSSGLDDVASGVGSVGEAAEDTKKKMQNMLAPFDELNILQEQQDEKTPEGTDTSGGGGISWGEVDPALLKALDESQYALEQVRMKALDVRDAILAFFGFQPDGDSWIYSPDIFEKNLMSKFPKWKKTIAALFDLDYSEVITQLGNIWGTLKEIAGLTFQNLANLFTEIFGMTPDEALASFIRNLPTNLQNINTWLQANKEEIADLAAKVLLAVAAWKVFATLAPALSTAFSTLSIAASGLSTVMSKAPSVVTPVGNLYTNLKSIFERLGFTVASTSGGFTGFNNQLALGGTTATGLKAKIAALAAKFSGPLAAGITAATVAAAALFIGGFVEWAKSSDEFREKLSKIFEQIGQIFTNFGLLFDNVKVAFGNACTLMSEYFGGVYSSISDFVILILQQINNIITFLNGVFSGDWKLALESLLNVGIDMFNMFGYAMAAVWNVIIGILNLAIQNILNLIPNAINSLLSGLSDVLEFVGVNLSVQVPTFDPIGPVSYTPFPHAALATGGVVSEPTRALIGEGMYDEAVVPLGNSPQLDDMLNRFAQKASETGTGDTIVKVYIGGKEWDTMVYKSSKRGEQLVGVNPIKEGGHG